MSVGMQPVTPGAPVYNADRDKKKIAITFDDGPNGAFTEGVLEALKNHTVTNPDGTQENIDIPATFFVIGEQAKRDPEKLREIRAAGHVIGSHTWDHADLTTLSDDQVRDELASTNQAIEDALGEKPTIFRAPYGSHNKRVDDIAASEGVRNILWDVDTEDWKRPGVSSIVEAADQAREGSIILMHDGGGDRSQTVTAVRAAVDRLLGEGYEFVTVPELLKENNGS